MGSKFIERHRRKSLLAALLLFFRGKARYVALLLLVMGASLPFVVSQDMLYRLVTFAPVSYVLRAAGLHSVIAGLNPAYSNEILRAAMDRAISESGQDSVWSNFLRGMSGTTGAGAGSSLAMLRGGEDYYRAGGPGKAGKAGPGEVAGAVSDADKARGAGADAVDFEDYLAGAAGAGGPVDGPGFGYMNSGAYGGSPGGGSPFMNRAILGKGPGAGGADDGVYGGAMNQAASRVPVAASKPVSGRQMGRVSGFSWRNAGYRTPGNHLDARINKQGAMFRLAETFATTGAAYNHPKASSEYQASYVGSTYDGNLIGGVAIQTDAVPPAVPDNSWVADMTAGAGELQELAKHCSKVSGEQAPHISENSDKMAKISAGMGKPPKCCRHGAVNRWNGKIEQIKALCRDNNARNAVISAACQNKHEAVNCDSHNKAKIKKCSRLKCWLSIILAILLIAVGAFLLGPLGIAMIVAGASMLISQLIPGIFGMLLGMLAGMLAAFYVGMTFAQKAIASAIKTVAGSGDESKK